MKTYEFTLKFSLPDASVDSEILLERLGEAGCDDALVGIGKTGRLALDFAREAPSAFAAISSAVADIRQAIPGARLAEATPDLVGLTDIADIIGCSRQNIRKLMLASGPDFPVPVHDGKSALWHLSNVLAWLVGSKQYAVDDALVEVAHTTMHFNLARDFGELDTRLQSRIHRLVS